MATPADFVEAARTYLGVRWGHLGRTRVAVDCIGLLLCAADDCGIEHIMPPIYERGRRGFDLYTTFDQIGKRVPLNEAQDGDILLFADGLFPAHTGIRSTKYDVPHVIHARVERRKVVEEPLTHEVLAALRRAYRPWHFVKE